MAFSDWDTTASGNATKPGINWGEGMLPPDINNSARQMMADLAALRNKTGAANIGADDGTTGGSLWTTLQGFIQYLRGANGASIISTSPTGAGAVARSVEAKLNEVVSVLDFGAVCDSGTTDDSAAFAAAVAAGYKSIYVPNGATIQAGLLTFANVNGVCFFGNGVQGSVIYVKGTTGDVVTFSNCQNSGFDGIGFRYVNEPTSGWVMKFVNNCFEPFARIRMDYHYNGVWVDSGSEPLLDIVSRYGFGSFVGVKFGDSAAGLYGATLRYHGDVPPAVGTTAYKAYAPSTTFNAGEVTFTGGRIFVCTQSGTTGASSAPNTTSGNRFLDDITDGTVKWRFMGRSDATHITVDSKAYSIRIEKSFGLNAAYTFRMVDTANTGTSYPKWSYLGLESDHALFAGISLEAGEGVYLNDNAWAGSCLGGNGIHCTNAFRGELTISPTTRVLGNAQHGLLIDTGSVYDIQGLFSGNSQLGSGTYHGVSVSAGVTDLCIRATCGRGRSATTTQGYGVFLNATADRFVVNGCNLSGNVTGGVTGPAASATRIYSNNIT